MGCKLGWMMMIGWSGGGLRFGGRRKLDAEKAPRIRTDMFVYLFMD